MAHDRPHTNHVIDGINKDVGIFGYERAKIYYLSLAKDWEDPYGLPVVETHDGVRVVRDDLIVGTKARAADFLLSQTHQDTIVYVQPRVGLAGVSLIDAAKRRGKKVVLFMPASKRISYHQACTIERGAEPHFHKIAAMPVLNKYAKDWADAHNAAFIPLGLKHELTTAALVKVASAIPEPGTVYCAISTGVLSRSLQIAWPEARFVSVAVARGLKAGELGRSEIRSHPYEFQKEEDEDKLPPFPTVRTYDAKVWRYIQAERFPPQAMPTAEYRKDMDFLMWNVGTDPVLQDPTIFDRVKSQRAWGE